MSKHYFLLLVVLAAGFCMLPPYDEATSLTYPTLKKLGSPDYVIGPIDDLHIESGDKVLYFTPLKIETNMGQGFLVAEREQELNMYFIQSNTCLSSTTSRPLDNSNKKSFNYYFDTAKGGEHAYFFRARNPNTENSILYQNYYAGYYYLREEYTAIMESTVLVTADHTLTSPIVPSLVAYDNVYVLAQTSASAFREYRFDLANPSFLSNCVDVNNTDSRAGGNIEIPAGTAWLENNFSHGYYLVHQAASSVLYSYFVYYDTTKSQYRGYRWSGMNMDIEDPFVFPGKPVAVLATDEILCQNSDNSILFVCDLRGTKKYSIQLGSLHFAYEMYFSTGACYNCVFTYVYTKNEDWDTRYYADVYIIPSDNLHKLAD